MDVQASETRNGFKSRETGTAITHWHNLNANQIKKADVREVLYREEGRQNMSIGYILGEDRPLKKVFPTPDWAYADWLTRNPGEEPILTE